MFTTTCLATSTHVQFETITMLHRSHDFSSSDFNKFYLSFKTILYVQTFGIFRTTVLVSPTSSTLYYWWHVQEQCTATSDTCGYKRLGCWQTEPFLLSALTPDHMWHLIRCAACITSKSQVIQPDPLARAMWRQKVTMWNRKRYVPSARNT